MKTKIFLVGLEHIATGWLDGWGTDDILVVASGTAEPGSAGDGEFQQVAILS